MAVLNDEQTMLRDMAQSWVTNESPVGNYRKIRDSGDAKGYDPATYTEMANMGWTGILVGEDHGGSDFGYLSIGLVLEQLGRTLTASPLAASAVAATTALNLAGNDAQKAAHLPGIAAGDTVATLAIDDGPVHSLEAIATSATKSGDGWVLNGTKAFVDEGDSADLFIVAAQTGSGLGLFLVPGDAAGLSRATRRLTDARSHAEITLKDVNLGADALLGAEDGAAVIEQILDRVRACTAAEMLGMADQAFNDTLEYMKTRTQFGQLLSSFQALQHRMAHLFTEIELMRSVVETALEMIDQGAKDEAIAKQVSLAKAISNDTLNLMSREMLQLHGGIGMTDEHDAGFYTKRARVLENAWGNASFHKDRFGVLSGI
ncbi:MAG: acyl-CoA dehydrogenase family protein [Alphaproteobacteria bacterium]